MGAASLHRIPWLAGLRIAAQRARHHRARNPEHDGAIPYFVLSSARRDGVACPDRSTEIGIRRPATLPGGSALQQSAGGWADRAGLWPRTREIDRRGKSAVPAGAGQAGDDLVQYYLSI